MNRQLLLSVLSAGFCAGNAGAVVTSVVPFSATPATLIAPPGSAGDGALAGGAFVWEERNDMVLPVPLPVDSFGFGVGIPAAFQTATFATHPGVIPAGTTISSFILHFDTSTNQTPGTAAFQVQTDQDIIGVILKDATLDASDAIVGAPTTYPLGLQYRGTASDPLEGGDNVIVGVPGDFALGYSRVVNVFAMDVEGALDEVRIITAPHVPEPASGIAALLATAAILPKRGNARLWNQC
jgi:hypothetical protein